MVETETNQNLTPDLAVENPQLYKQLCIAKFSSDERRKNFLAAMRIQGRFPGINESLEKFQLNNQTWMSSSEPHEKGVVLGTKDMNLYWNDQGDFRGSTFFEGEMYSYTDQIMHILAHEFAHKIPSIILYENKYVDIKIEFQSLMQKLIQIRGQYNLGLTQIGTFEGQWGKSVNAQAAEDFADLTAMYLTDSERFGRYQEFMGNPYVGVTRTNNGLVSLENREVQDIFNSLRIIVDKFTEPQASSGPFKLNIQLD